MGQFEPIVKNAYAVQEAFGLLRAEIVALGRVNRACPQEVPIHHWGWTALLGAWKTMREDPLSFWNATWVE